MTTYNEKTNTLQNDYGVSNYEVDWEQARLVEERWKQEKLEEELDNYRRKKLYNSLNEDVRQKYLKILLKNPEIADKYKEYPFLTFDYAITKMAKKDGYTDVELSDEEYALIEGKFNYEYKEEIRAQNWVLSDSYSDYYHGEELKWREQIDELEYEKKIAEEEMKDKQYDINWEKPTAEEEYDKYSKKFKEIENKLNHEIANITKNFATKHG